MNLLAFRCLLNLLKLSKFSKPTSFDLSPLFIVKEKIKRTTLIIMQDYQMVLWMALTESQKISRETHEISPILIIHEIESFGANYYFSQKEDSRHLSSFLFFKLWFLFYIPNSLDKSLKLWLHLSNISKIPFSF